LEPLDSNRRIPELDGLRGVAILLVLFFHYFASSPLLPRYVSAFGRLSWSGVDLFFVLSGFLLGGILLDAKTSPQYFKTFYARRAYRILPVYGLTLILFWILAAVWKVSSNNVSLQWLFSGSFPWYIYATLTQNFAMTLGGTLGPAWLGPTWSLAVEEQFYLTLPLMIRYLSRRRLPFVLGSIIIAAPVCRALLRLFYANGIFGAFVLMPCRADSLMLGVAGALVLKSDRGLEFLVRRKRLIYGVETLLLAGMVWMARKETSVAREAQLTQVIAGSPQMVAHSLSNLGHIWFLFRIYGRTAISSLDYTWIALFYLGLLLIALTQRQSLLSRGLRNRWLMATGIIAYGTYLFHQGVLGLYYGLARGGRLPVILNLSDLGLTVIALVTTLALAKVSWVYFEMPLVKRAHKYGYEPVDRS
jgi:peptidoglycan/LPS O-acetylase OafA/YrhL